MSENEKSLDVGIIDYNPNRMSQKEAADLGIPEQLQPFLADKRQYPINIARHFPDGTSWFSADSPWFFRSIMSSEEQIKKIKKSDVLILSGSGMSAYKFQENDFNSLSLEDRELLKKSQELIKDQLGDGKWVLGICFGGQLAIQAVGGKIGRLPIDEAGRTITEAGWLDHQLTDVGKQDEIFSHLSDKFYAPHLHNDFVAKLPEVGTPIETTSGKIKVIRSEVLAIRKGYLGKEDMQSTDKHYIQASLVEFDNGARLYQIQPHPEMASLERANFLVRQNRWIADEMGDDYYHRALKVPRDADFSVALIITEFIKQARKYYEETKAIEFVRSVVGQNVEQFARYLLK